MKIISSNLVLVASFVLLWCATGTVVDAQASSSASSTTNSGPCIANVGSASSGGVTARNCDPVPTPTPEPTYITKLADETPLKLSYFFIALIIFAVPAILACAIFLTKHQRRLAAVRALQEAKSKGTTDDGAANKNIAEGTGGTSALNSGALEGNGAPGSPNNKNLHNGIPVFTMYNVSHTPPEKNLLPPTSIYAKPPFTEDQAVLTEAELLGAKPTQVAEESILGGKSIMGGFGGKSNLMAADGDVGDSGFGASGNHLQPSVSEGAFGASGRSMGGSRSMRGGAEDENPLVTNGDYNESSETASPKSWGKNRGGKKKAEW